MRPIDDILKESELLKARQYAITCHAGQMYGPNKPYVYHLDKVVRMLQYHNVDDLVTLQAGYLHDVLEDTPTTQNQLEFTFGVEVTNIVQLVTDKKPGSPRAERHAATYPLIRENNSALRVKLGDRIANMYEGTKNDMYIKEYSKFKEYLYSPNNGMIIASMWHTLDQLAGVDKQ